MDIQEMKKKKKKYKTLVFRVKVDEVERLDVLAGKLGLDRSKSLRLALNDAVVKYVEKDSVGDIVAVDATTIKKLTYSLLKRIDKLESAI